jgi:mannitol-1-phosphate 5-dehydrogenase
MKAVVFGPGRIGCGLVGQLLRASGYQVVFIGRSAAMVDYLNRVQAYRIKLVDGVNQEEIVVEGVRAVLNTMADPMTREIADADLIATAVGAGNLSAVAPNIAQGLRHRKRPVNVLAFENLSHGGPFLQNLVRDHLPAGFPLDRFGFSGVVISRAVAQRWLDAKSGMMTFLGDPPERFVVDGGSLREPLPRIRGMKIADDFDAWFRRKLFIFSAGHAVCAYLGHLKGYQYIHSAIRDPEIRQSVLAAMAEGQRGLAQFHGAETAGDQADLMEIVQRFENAVLNDPIHRVARDPQRKLKVGDRLVGAALLAQKAGIPPQMLTLGAVAAFCYLLESDPQAEKLSRYLEVDEAGEALCRLSGIEDPDQPFCRRIGEAWMKLVKGFKKNNQLLHIEPLLWAWI